MREVGKVVNENVEAMRKQGATWGTIQTKKSLVIRLSTRGTRILELHLDVLSSGVADRLRGLFGKNLEEAAAMAINPHLSAEDKKLFEDNPISGVRWAIKGKLIIMCAKSITDPMREALVKALACWMPDSSQHSILVLNKPPTTELKFMAVLLTRHSNGKEITVEEFRDQLR